MIDVIEQNTLAGMKAWECWPGFALHENSQITYGLTSIPFHIFNNILHIQAQSNQVGSLFEDVQKHSVPLRCWISPNTRPTNLANHLKSNGWTHSFEGTGMAINLKNFNYNIQDSNDLIIEKVYDIGMLQKWASCFADIFNLPLFTQKAWHDVHASMFLSEKPWEHYLATISGRPVAIGSTFVENNVAGIANIATLPALRSSGIGTTMTLHLLRECQEKRCKMGVLISTPVACKMYGRIGFKEHYKCDFYKWLPTENV